MVMSIGSSRASKVSSLGTVWVEALSAPVRSVIEIWNQGGNSEFPSLASWVRHI